MGHLLGALRFLFKFCFYTVLAFLFFFVVFIVMMLNFDVNKHKDVIEQAFNTETGLKLRLHGPIETEYFPVPMAHFSRVEIINESNEATLSLFIMDSVVELDLLSLLGDVIKVNRFDAKGVKIKVQEDKKTKLEFDIDTFSGQILSSYREIVIPSFTFKSDNNEVTGDFKLMLLSHIPIVAGNFYSRQFNINLQTEKDEQPLKVFNTKIIALDWMNDLNGKINWHFANLFIGNLSIEDSDVQIVFKDKNLELIPRGKVASGDFTGKMRLNKRDNTIQVTSEMRLKNGIASEFFQQFWKNAALLNGKLDINFEGKSYGVSLADWMAHLSGRSIISIKNMQIQDRDIDARYLDVFAAIWKSLNPSKNGTSLECAALLLNAEEGQVVAKETIAMQTNDIYALGGGVIDLKNENIDLTFDLYPRSQMNIEVGSLDQVVHVRGSLAHPELVKSPKGMIKEGGTLLLGVATGGMSLLAEKMLKIVSQKSSPCQQVLAEAYEDTSN